MDILPIEIKGNILSRLPSSTVSELKYLSKDMFYATRYLPYLEGRVNLKKLFIKTKNNTYTFFYYNLSFADVVIVNSDDLKLVPILLNKVKSLTITNENIIDSFKLI